MRCRILTEPRELADLIRDLNSADAVDESHVAAFTCTSPSAEEPGRQRVWVVPRNNTAGANPTLWVRENQPLFKILLRRSVAGCTIVCPGSLPTKVAYAYIDIKSGGDRNIRSTDDRLLQSVRCGIRVLSAPAYLWVDVLGLHTAGGDIDHGRRGGLFTRLAMQHWNDQKERVYIPPPLELVQGASDKSMEARDLLLNREPACLDKGLTVLYGAGGIGKTFFLHRLAAKLGAQARQDSLASIPVFIHAPVLLHQYALETWLSQHGFARLTLRQITSLLQRGLLIPMVDALDEVVKGKARYGGQEFLNHMVELMHSKGFGRGLLACRDLYLNYDRLVPQVVREWGAAELSFGFFDHHGRRRFVEARTGLDEGQAAKWTRALEQQAAQIWGLGLGEEVEKLIGHPVILDSLAEYINDLPQDRRAAAVDQFRITSPNIFGNMIDQLLWREQEKVSEGWKEAFEGLLNVDWLDPAAPQKQRDVLSALTLLVARDGAEEVEVRALQDDRYGDLKHGVFMFTGGVRRGASTREALQLLLVHMAGTPEPAETVPEQERDAIRREAREHLAEIYAGHILANTQPDLPDDLVFAFRLRAFFDYFLADAVVTQLQRALQSRRAEQFVEWCEKHHVWDTFSTCLDFLLWDQRVVRDGMNHLIAFFEEAGPSDDTLSSYLISFALALFLRRERLADKASIDRLSFAPVPDWDLLLVPEMLPDHISQLRVTACSFPRLTIDGIDFSDVDIDSCDFETLRIMSSRWSHCNMTSIECSELRLGGTVTFCDSILDLAGGSLVVEHGANVGIYNCQVSEQVKSALEQYESAGAPVTLSSVTLIPSRPEVFVAVAPGRRFVIKLMALLCKAGHKEFAVYEKKLRGRTLGTDEQFTEAINCLLEHGCVERRKEMVIMTPQGTAHMYQPKPGTEPSYESYQAYWDPIVNRLNQILGS